MEWYTEQRYSERGEEDHFPPTKGQTGFSEFMCNKVEFVSNIPHIYNAGKGLLTILVNKSVFTGPFYKTLSNFSYTLILNKAIPRCH